MISRRGFFGMLAGVAASPVLAKIEALLPEPNPTTQNTPFDQPRVEEGTLRQLVEELNYRLAVTLNALIAMTGSELEAASNNPLKWEIPNADFSKYSYATYGSLSE